MDTTDVFISYGRGDDEPFTERLYEDLSARGFRIWWDRRSMPSRGLAFTQEIRDAIDRAGRFVLIVGPRALESVYVRSEWQHALLFAKAVVPVLRIGKYAALPDDLRAFHCADLRDSRAYNEGLDEVVRILSEPLPALGSLRTDVPRLPPHLLSVRADLDRLTTTVMPDVGHAIVVTAAQQTTVIHGMGGSGKSVLAAAFATATRTRRAFVDGVVWLTIGQDGARPARALAAAFGEDPTAYADRAEANARLPALLEGKRCLIVLDDVWDVAEVRPIHNALGPRCRLLVTSRDARLTTALGAQGHEVRLFDNSQSLDLLATWTGQAVETLPTDAHDVARHCAGLALALALCGAQVRDGTSWADMREALDAADLEFLDHPYGSIMKSLKVSVDALGADEAARYAQLVVFPPTAVASEPAVLTMWAHTGGLSERRSRRLLADLHSKALIRLDGDAPHRSVLLHDLQRDYLRRPPNDDAALLHRELVEAYRLEAPQGWPSGPNDGYFFEHLSEHLIGAGLTAELLELLCSAPAWMDAKLLAVADLTSCLDDVDAAWQAIADDGGRDLATRGALQAARQLVGASSDRDDLEIELLVKLTRSPEALRSVRGRADVEARFAGLLVIDAALRETATADAAIVNELESVARTMSDSAALATSLATLGARIAATDAGRSRSLLDEALALSVAQENIDLHIEVIEALAPALHDLGDQRLGDVLAGLESRARTLEVPRARTRALGRLATILTMVGADAQAAELLTEVREEANRLTQQGDVTLKADLGLFGIHLPGDATAEAAPDSLDAVLRQTAAVVAAGDPRDSSDALADAEARISEVPDALMRDILRGTLAQLLVDAGAIDSAIDIASCISAEFRPSAQRRIVRAMLASGDSRAEPMFLEVEASAGAGGPDKADRWAALGAVSLALRRAAPALSEAIHSELAAAADAERDRPSDPLVAIALAKALARLGDLRFQGLFDTVFQHAAAAEGEAMALAQMVLRELADALLDLGFAAQAKVAIRLVRLPDQMAFALTELARRLADDGDFATAEQISALVDYEDLAEAARIHVLAARAAQGDQTALGRFDDWAGWAGDLRRRFWHERALSGLARALCVLGRLREAREVIASIRAPQLREQALGVLATRLAQEGSPVDALQAVPPQSIDGFVRTAADLAPMFDRAVPGQGLAALREVIRVVAWVRADWKDIDDRFAGVAGDYMY